MEAAFKKNIQTKVAFIESLSKQGEQPRCMDHNIPFSLYCTFCRKPICASCMYNFGTHKSHKVQPLEQATKDLREDLDNLQTKLETKLKCYYDITADLNNRTMETSSIFSKTATAINRFYDDLFEQLRLKKQEQLALLTSRQKEAHFEFRALSRTVA
jgi:hypothetical protein